MALLLRSAEGGEGRWPRAGFEGDLACVLQGRVWSLTPAGAQHGSLGGGVGRQAGRGWLAGGSGVRGPDGRFPGCHPESWQMGGPRSWPEADVGGVLHRE